MRVIHLDARRLAGLSVSDSADRWLSTLASAGVGRAGDAPAGSERAEMSALIEELWRVAALEEVIAAGRVTSRFHFAPPRRWWLWLPIGYALCLLIALSRTHFEDRLITFAVLLNVLGAAAVGVVLWVLAASFSWRRQRQRAAAEAADERSLRMAALVRRQAALLERTFALRTGDRVVVNCPDLRWVEDELRRLPPSGHDARRRALQDARQTLHDAIQVIARQPDPDSRLLLLDRAATSLDG